MKRRLFSHAVLTVSLAMASVHVSAQTRWDLPSAYSATNFHTVNMAQFAADVDKATAGKLKVTLHPNASLFKMPEIKRAVQGGQAQLGEIALLVFENEWPMFGADGLPFLATSYDDAMKLYRAQKPVLEKRLGAQGIMVLYTVPWSPQGLYSRKPIASGADLKGMKWRAYSPSTSRIAELLGAQPVTVQAAEVTQALATGVVDALMTSSTSGVDGKFFENVKYYYDVQAWIPKNAVLMNKRAFEGLGKAEQDAVLKAAADAQTRGWAAAIKENDAALATLKANGMTIEQPSAKLKADLQTVGETMLKEWLAKAGPEGTAVLEAYRK